jgi:hypothetical protein
MHQHVHLFSPGKSPEMDTTGGNFPFLKHPLVFNPTVAQKLAGEPWLLTAAMAVTVTTSGVQ